MAGMTKPRQKRTLHRFILTVAPAVLLLGALVVYVDSYLSMSYLDLRYTSMGPIRVFRGKWQQVVFLPAMKVESLIRGYKIAPAYLPPGTDPV